MGAETPEPVPGLAPSDDKGTFRFTVEVDGEQFAAYQRGPGAWSYDWLSGPNPGYGFGMSGPPIEDPEQHREHIRGFLRDIDPATGFIQED